MRLIIHKRDRIGFFEQKWWKWKLLCTFLFFNFANAKRQIMIGGIFHPENVDEEIAFRQAVTRENMYNPKMEIVPIIRKLDAIDSYQAEKIVCSLAADGVVAIFGPSSTETFGIVASVCNELGIPHIVAQWIPEEFMENENHKFTRNFFPHSAVFNRALAQIIVDYEWKKGYTLIYENDESLERLQDVLQIHEPGDTPITVRQLGDDDDYQPLLKEIETSGVNHIILDCNPDKITQILKQAVGVKMMEEYQNYIITSLDSHTLDFAELKFVRANITTIRMMSPTSLEVMTAVHDWRQATTYSDLNSRTSGINAENIKTNAAMMHDAVRVYATVLREFHALRELNPTSLKCSHPTRWAQGHQILEHLDMKTEEGMTGRIVFNDEGQRTEFYMEVLELSQEGFKKIATWDPVLGINYTRTAGEVYTEVARSLQNKTVIVASRLGMPYLRLKVAEEGEYLEGNNRFEGYALDLIDSISKILGFQYRFEIVPDNNYGSFNKQTKKWNGLVKHLLDRKADLAICDLTITYERRTAVDFTMPFMTLGISILYAKPTKEPPLLFSFMSPLSLDVWLYMATAYLCVSVLLFFLAKMAADDWENPHPCEKDPEELETIWDMKNCIWLTVGSIMQQGCDLLPKAISTRISLGLWWFFALIVISSYTANLAAFLTMERMDVSIESADDLAKQSKIKYGTVRGGSTMNFFKYSNFSTYQRMWAVMESAEPSVFTKSNDEGEERVTKGNRMYAFLMESTGIEYIVERNCNLTQVGGLLDSKGYGIAMPTNSPYRTHISQTVLKLQEEGKLIRLKQKWWKEIDIEDGCADDSAATDDTPELGMDNVGGVFLVLACGCGCAIIIGILEFLWNIRKIAVDEVVTPWEAFKAELLFAMDIRIQTKPVRNTTRGSSESFSSKSAKSSLSKDNREIVNADSFEFNKTL